MKTPAPTVIRAMDMYFTGESSLSIVDRAVLFVAMQGSKIVGTVVLKFTNQKTQAEFARLFVHPSHRQNGIASALLAECESIAKNAGIIRLTATVHRENTMALGFYENIGFVPVYQFADGDILICRAI